MNRRIRVGICGYGNLGRGVESEIAKNPDLELVAVFTRRKPVESLKIKADVPVVHVDDSEAWKDKIDVMILCGGSATDLPEQTPQFAKVFNVVDSFDTHANIPQHLKKVDKVAKTSRKIAIISAGWDPGLSSLMRLYFGATIPKGETHTFWGRGVSQGHSDAIRRIEGVENAISYTIPNESAKEKARGGEGSGLTTRDKHTRLCYVVASEDADKAAIQKEIKEMPNYFADYDTTVNFVSNIELTKNHAKLPHGTNVILAGETGNGNRHVLEYTHKIDSNPEFTASILLMYARAAFRMARNGESGARTVFDIPPILLSSLNSEEIVKNLL